MQDECSRLGVPIGSVRSMYSLSLEFGSPSSSPMEAFLCSGWRGENLVGDLGVTVDMCTCFFWGQILSQLETFEDVNTIYYTPLLFYRLSAHIPRCDTHSFRFFSIKTHVKRLTKLKSFCVFRVKPQVN